jgi:RND family efflux transporter MFP subunit
MQLLRKRWFLTLLAAGLLIGGPLAWFKAVAPATGAAEDGGAVIAAVKQGEFKVVVNSTGELRAKKFVQISGPANAQQAQQYQMKISSLVPEGTVVKQGDVVAELDRSGIAARMQEVSLALQKAQAQYTQAQLDSTLALATAREDIKNLEFALEEKRIAKEQAQFEAPSIKRQAEIDYEKATRQLAQAKVNYQTKRQQSIAKMSEVSSDVQRQQNMLNVVTGVMQDFTIRAPAPGMVIYVREWNGRKKSVGSQVQAWEPTVATLPDMTEMESVTYINEIDVRKLAVGQKVRLTLDADPSKKLTGKVVQVANVGEQRPNADAKVFEVKIAVEQSDTTLRPGMTTGNAIETAAVPNALFVPLEAVFNEGSTTFVYRRSGGRLTRQEVETGAMNDNEIVVVRGLEKDDRVLLSPPPDGPSMTLVALPGGGGRPPAQTPPATGDSGRSVPVPAVPGKAAAATARSN